MSAPGPAPDDAAVSETTPGGAAPRPGPPPPAGGAAQNVVAWYAEGFSDRIGDRLQLFDSSAPGLELLRFSATLTGHEGFEERVRARVAALERFRHTAFARIRRVTQLDDPRPQLALVSDLVPGERLARVMSAARTAGLQAGSSAALYLLRQLLPPLAALHTHDGAHGVLTADRIVVTPKGELVITEHVLGPALDALGLGAAELWQRFGLADGGTRLTDPRADVIQVALLATGLLVDRPFEPSDYPGGVAGLLREASPRLADADGIAIGMWLRRALALEGPPYPDAGDALAALDALLWDAPGAWMPGLLPNGAQPAQQPRQPPRAALPPSTLPVRAPRSAVARRPPGSVLFKPQDYPRVEPRVVQSARRFRRATIVLTLLAVIEAGALGALALRWQADLLAWLPPVEEPSASIASTADSGRYGTGTDGASYYVVRDPDPDRGRREMDEADEIRARVRAAFVSPTPGWVAIEAAGDVQVFANGRLLGSVARGRFALPPGTHQITLVNQALGLRHSEEVRLAAGETVTLTAALPSSSAVSPQR
jgi:hypothetical protein